MRLKHLPDDSPLSRAVGGDVARWTQDTHLLATIVDRLGALDYHVRGAWFQTAGQPPEPIERPGASSTAQPRVVTAAEIDARLNRGVSRVD